MVVYVKKTIYTRLLDLNQTSANGKTESNLQDLQEKENQSGEKRKEKMHISNSVHQLVVILFLT